MLESVLGMGNKRSYVSGIIFVQEIKPVYIEYHLDLKYPIEHRGTRRHCFFRNFGVRKTESNMEGVDLDTSYQDCTKSDHSFL